MNLRSWTAIFLLLVGIASVAQCSDTTKTCTVTYIANEGFLIQTTNHKILVDALFGGIEGNWCDQPGDSVSRLMLNGTPPFDNIDVVLVTHKHRDHFNAPMVVTFLKNNPKSVLICPEQATDLLKQSPGSSSVNNRVLSIRSQRPLDTLLNVNTLAIRVLGFHHGAYLETDSVTGTKFDRHAAVQNLEYLVELDGFTIFHSGDGSTSDSLLYKTYGFGVKPIDIVFLDRGFLGRDGQKLMNAYLGGSNIVFMHIEPGRREYIKSVIKSVPEMCVFTKGMETKVFAKSSVGK